MIFKLLIFKSIFKKVGSVCMQTPSGYKVKGVSFAQVFSCFVVVFFYNLPTNKFEHQSIFLVLLTNPMSCENSIKRVFDFRNPAQWPFWYDIFQKNIRLFCTLNPCNMIQFHQKKTFVNFNHKITFICNPNHTSLSNLLKEKKIFFGQNFANSSHSVSRRVNKELLNYDIGLETESKFYRNFHLPDIF